MRYLRRFNENSNSDDNKRDLILKYFGLIKMDLAMGYYTDVSDMIYKTINSVKDTHNIIDFNHSFSGLNVWLYDYKKYEQMHNIDALSGYSSERVFDLYNKLLSDDIRLSFCFNSDLEFEKDYIDEIVSDDKIEEYENRYSKYFKNLFQKKVENNEFETHCEIGIRKNTNIVYIHLTFIMNEPIMFDIFKDPIKAITKYPTLVNYLYNYVNDDDFYELVNKHPEDLKDTLKDNALLKYTKHSKQYDDPDRYEMEESSDCYLLLCKDKFTENEDGTFTKDLDIESILKIDPYDKEEYGSTLMGMKMRARFQEGLSLNIIWLPKEYDIDDDDINSDDNRELRKSIRQTMEVIR